MFKIKLGLKSFQTHSIQKCKYQIGGIVNYLKNSSASFQPTVTKSQFFHENREKGAEDFFAPPLTKKCDVTLRKTPDSNLPRVEGRLRSSIFAESLVLAGSPFTVARKGHSKLRFHEQVYFRDPTFYKQGIFHTGVHKPGSQDTKKGNDFLDRESDHTRKVPGDKKSTFVKGFLGVTPLPRLLRKMTTLRSPHIDKKSREQFEWKREKAQIHFHLNSVAQISLALFILTHSRFPGVEVEIGIESKTYFA